MTRVYLCWSLREPEFQQVLPDCNLLVSPALVTKVWNVQSWRKLPESLMIDSGAFTQTKKKGIFDVRTCLSAQVRITEGWPGEKEAILIHYDKPLSPSLPFDLYQSRVGDNLDAAREYIDLFPRQKNLTPMAVIHALDGETLASSFLELKSMGYRRFAIGSLVALLYRDRARLLEILNVCQQIGLAGIHVLGIASPSLLRGQIGSWLGSFDSSAPVRQAIGGTIFYSEPFERFVLRPTGPQKLTNRTFGNRSSLNRPRSCGCPVCAEDPEALLSQNEIEVRQSRKIHNAYHLIREVRSWDA